MIKITDKIFIESNKSCTMWDVLIKTDSIYSKIDEKEKMQDAYEAGIERDLKQWDLESNKINTPAEVQEHKNELLYYLSPEFRKLKDEQKAREKQEADNAKVIEEILKKKQ